MIAERPTPRPDPQFPLAADAFASLLSQIALTHPSLREKTQKLDADWSTGDARDTALTAIVAGVRILLEGQVDVEADGFFLPLRGRRNWQLP